MLDSAILYSTDEDYEALESYGPEGRAFMLWTYCAWDVIVPLLYTSFICLTISWLFSRGLESESKVRLLNLAPIIGGMLDYLENLSTVTLILNYPSRLDIVASLGSLSTLGKYTSGLVLLSLILMGVVKAAQNKFRVKELRDH